MEVLQIFMFQFSLHVFKRYVFTAISFLPSLAPHPASVGIFVVHLFSDNFYLFHVLCARSWWGALPLSTGDEYLVAPGECWMLRLIRKPCRVERLRLAPMAKESQKQ